MHEHRQRVAMHEVLRQDMERKTGLSGVARRPGKRTFPVLYLVDGATRPANLARHFGGHVRSCGSARIEPRWNSALRCAGISRRSEARMRGLSGSVNTP
jgi:hypothetical protein